MESILGLMVRKLNLHPIATRGGIAIELLTKATNGFTRGHDLVEMYRGYDMGWRCYDIELPKESGHFKAGGVLRLSARNAEAIANGVDLHPFSVLLDRGLFPFGEDATGSGDIFAISLTDEDDFNIYCVYDGEVAPADPRDACEFMVKVIDLSDPNTVVHEPPGEEPPAPPA